MVLCSSNSGSDNVSNSLCFRTKCYACSRLEISRVIATWPSLLATDVWTCCSFNISLDTHFLMSFSQTRMQSSFCWPSYKHSGGPRDAIKIKHLRHTRVNIFACAGPRSTWFRSLLAPWQWRCESVNSRSSETLKGIEREWKMAVSFLSYASLEEHMSQKVSRTKRTGRNLCVLPELSLVSEIQHRRIPKAWKSEDLH